MNNPVGQFFDRLAENTQLLVEIQKGQQITIDALTRRVAQLEYAYQRVFDAVDSISPVVTIPIQPSADHRVRVNYKQVLEYLQKACTELIEGSPYIDPNRRTEAFKQFGAAVEWSLVMTQAATNAEEQR